MLNCHCSLICGKAILHISWKTVFLWSLYLKWPQKASVLSAWLSFCWFVCLFYKLCQGQVFSTDSLVGEIPLSFLFKGHAKLKGNVCVFVAVNRLVWSGSLVLIWTVRSFVSVLIVNNTIPEGFILCYAFSSVSMCRNTRVYCRQIKSKSNFSNEHSSPFFSRIVPLHFWFSLLHFNGRSCFFTWPGQQELTLLPLD